MPDERKFVPLGPCLSPGIFGVTLDAAEKLREKLVVRGLLAAINVAEFIVAQTTIRQK